MYLRRLVGEIRLRQETWVEDAVNLNLGNKKFVHMRQWSLEPPCWALLIGAVVLHA